MEPMKLYFDVRDIFRAPRLALSGKKIWTLLEAYVVAYVVYLVLTHVSWMTTGLSFGESWNNYGLYPQPPIIEQVSWVARLVSALAIVGTLLILSLGATAVARITYKQLKGDEFYSSKDAWRFVKKHWHAPVFTHISIAIIALFFVIMAAIFALIGRIPYVGELFFGIPYLLWFSGSVFVVYTAVVFVVSVFFTHAIVATMEEDTMGSVFQNYSLTWSQPWRIVIYVAIIFVLMTAGTVIFGVFMKLGYDLINVVFGHKWLMGHAEKLQEMVLWAIGGKLSDIAALWGWNPPSHEFFLPDPSLTSTEYIAGFFIGLSLFIIHLVTIAYVLSIETVGETLALVICKKKSEEENLLERKDEEELEAESAEEETEWSAEAAESGAEEQSEEPSEEKTAESEGEDSGESEGEQESEDKGESG